MKKYIFATIMILVFVLGELFLLATYMPKNTMTLDEMFEKGGQETNTFKVLEYKQFYIEVEFNGEKYNLAGNKKDYVEVYNVGARKLAWEFLFDREHRNFWIKTGVEYILFGRYEEMVFIQKDQLLPVVDPSKWDGTRATIAIWPFFHRSYNSGESYIAENCTTGEIALVFNAEAYDISGNAFIMRLDNGPTWGYVHVQKFPSEAVSLAVTEFPDYVFP